MVRRGNPPTAAVCTIIRSKPKKIQRSGSRTSLDVKGSFVMKKVWKFEGLSEYYNSDDQLSDRDTVKDDTCNNHSWFLFTNLACSQHCTQCTKRILPHRASYKCTACKKLCHLKCAIKSNNSSKENRREENINTEMDQITRDMGPEIVPKQHTQTRNIARLQKQMQKEEEEIADLIDGEENNDEENNDESKKKSDLNSSRQSQAKQKLSSMKSTFVKRCKSIKKKVQKKKKDPVDQVDRNNNRDTAPPHTEETIEAERQAWVTSPIRTRLRSRRAQLAEQSESLDKSSESRRNAGSFDQLRGSVTDRRGRQPPMQVRKPKVKAFLHEYDLTISHIRDRLDIVEGKIKQLQTTIPNEMGKWKNLQHRFREDSSFSPFDSIPMDSMDAGVNSINETHLKRLEADNNLPSLSSGAASDEIFLVKEKSSTSSQEYSDQSAGRMGKRDIEQPFVADFRLTEEASLPSAIPVEFRSGKKVVDHHTSTPLTDRNLGYFKKSHRKNPGKHSLKHTSVIKMETSSPLSRHHTYAPTMEIDMEQNPKENVLSPEQKGVKHFLRQRSDKFLQHSLSFNRSPYSSPPVASSTFCHQDDSILASETSPFSFSFRNDRIDRSQVSFHESKREGHYSNTSPHQNCSSNLSYTFRNDSQMIQTNENEDLPGYTRNHSFRVEGGGRVQGTGPSDESPVEDEVDMAKVPVQYMEVPGPERPGSSLLTDRTSLTNVTQPTGDFVNSFDHNRQENKSRWINKDVFMFTETIPRQFDFPHKKSPSPAKMDERGDSSNKPPFAHHNKTGRNFVVEAEDKLKSFRIRRNSRESITVGACFDGGPSDDGGSSVHENFVKEEVSQREQIAHTDIENKFVEMEFQIQSRENTLQEFEKMEKLYQDESLDEHRSWPHRKKPSLSKLESQIIVDTDKVPHRSISRTSSMESKNSAKYHFLHDKGMIKIESPSLKLVTGEHRRQGMRSNLFEDQRMNVMESGSESELDALSIDDDFRLGHPERLISTDIGSEVTESKTDEITSEMDETDSQSRLEQQQILEQYHEMVKGRQEYWDQGAEQKRKEEESKRERQEYWYQEAEQMRKEEEFVRMRQEHWDQEAEQSMKEEEFKLMMSQANGKEQEMLDNYLKTVDEGQETWDSVMKWMHKECDDAEGEEFDAELKLMIGQDGGLEGPEGVSQDEEMQENSIYYSFQAQSDDIQHLIRPDCESALQGYQDNTMEDISDDGSQSSLMYTIINGSIEDVKRLLNSDRTISESEIKEALIWALNSKDLPITTLLLEDICKLLRAAEEESFIDVFPAYGERNRWEPVFVVLSRSDPVAEWDMFMGLPVYRRRYDLVSVESELVENHSHVRSHPLPSYDREYMNKVINTADLHTYHSQIMGLQASAFRSRKEGKEIVQQGCIVIQCLLKGFIPFWEDPFPSEIDGIPTDVREAFSDDLNEHVVPKMQNGLSNKNIQQNLAYQLDQESFNRAANLHNVNTSPRKQTRLVPTKSPRTHSPGKSYKSPQKQSPGKSYKSPQKQSPGKSYKSPQKQSAGKSYKSPQKQSAGKSYKSPQKQSPGKSYKSPQKQSPGKSYRSSNLQNGLTNGYMLGTDVHSDLADYMRRHTVKDTMELFDRDATDSENTNDGVTGVVTSNSVTVTAVTSDSVTVTAVTSDLVTDLSEESLDNALAKVTTAADDDDDDDDGLLKEISGEAVPDDNGPMEGIKRDQVT